nr:CorA family divalent cation transporter [Pseudoduganella namucuonensis]
MPGTGADQTSQRPWELLRGMADDGGANPWREVVDEFNGDAANFHERHYNEFVTFLPFVQRFLYGEARAGRAETGGAGMRVFRRHDVARARVVAKPGDAPRLLDIVHIDLYFFFDVDVVMLNVEVAASDLELAQAQELLYRFGRGYPAGWDEQGQALHCMSSVEWLDARGDVLSRSDAQQRDAFLAHVCEKRAPRIAAHWQFLLEPLVYDLSDRAGPLRYRQIEYYRMPVMAFLAVDDPRALSREDFVRLGLVTGQNGGALPYSGQHLGDFERQVCYDRFWTGEGAAPNTRYLCSGLSLIVVGDANADFFCCRDRGVLAQFRHQHFLVFMIAHLQKSSLLMFSDRLAEALNCLNVVDANSVRRFKRRIRSSFEGFLRFTHRYWFKDISEQALVRALYDMCSTQLGLEKLHAEVKVRVEDMNGYLEADSLRRQANTVVRLTVVTIFGLIGTVTTGFLGMNLLAEADAPMDRRLTIFGVTFIVTTVLTAYTMVKSKRLSDFLDVLSDERLPLWTKAKALVAVWRPEKD